MSQTTNAIVNEQPHQSEDICDVVKKLKSFLNPYSENFTPNKFKFKFDASAVEFKPVSKDNGDSTQQTTTINNNTPQNSNVDQDTLMHLKQLLNPYSVEFTPKKHNFKLNMAAVEFTPNFQYINNNNDQETIEDYENDVTELDDNDLLEIIEMQDECERERIKLETVAENPEFVEYMYHQLVYGNEQEDDTNNEAPVDDTDTIIEAAVEIINDDETVMIMANEQRKAIDPKNQVDEISSTINVDLLKQMKQFLNPYSVDFVPNKYSNEQTSTCQAQKTEIKFNPNATEFQPVDQNYSDNNQLSEEELNNLIQMQNECEKERLEIEKTN